VITLVRFVRPVYVFSKPQLEIVGCNAKSTPEGVEFDLPDGDSVLVPWSNVTEARMRTPGKKKKS